MIDDPVHDGVLREEGYDTHCAAAIAKGLTLEEARKAVTMEAYKDLTWPNLLVPNIRAVYQEMKAEKNK